MNSRAEPMVRYERDVHNTITFTFTDLKTGTVFLEHQLPQDTAVDAGRRGFIEAAGESEDKGVKVHWISRKPRRFGKEQKGCLKLEEEIGAVYEAEFRFYGHRNNFGSIRAVAGEAPAPDC